MKATRAKLLGESLVYKYALEYVITHLPGKFLENRMRFLEGYSILYIQVPLTMEYPKS